MTNSKNFQHGGLNRGRHVAVIGGGIGGLTAALAFAQSGARVVVHEQASELSEVGAGLQITPNGARVLAAMGLNAQLDARAIAAQAVVPTDAMTGRTITRFDLTQLSGPPYRFLHRADLIDILAEACRAQGVTIELGSRADAADLDAAGPTADVIVGADGIRSVTRTQLNHDAGWITTHQTAWRAVVDVDEGTEDVARIWMAPRRHVVTYPLTGGRLNIVAVCERKDQPAEGWHHADDPANLSRTFADCDASLRAILERVETTHLWGLNLHEVARNWTDGRICLLGDAAHPTLPFLAQGANLAIEDAYVMAKCLSESEDVAAGLVRYQHLREPRVLRAIAAANANAKSYHLSGIARRVAHTGLKTLGKVAPNVFLNRMSWLYGHEVTK